MPRLFFCVALSLLWCVAAHAGLFRAYGNGGFIAVTATYYIAPSGVDRAGCGTSGNPCATPNGVATNNAPLLCGSVIKAAAGTYSQPAMRITATPRCPAQNDVVMVECATPFACSGTAEIEVKASYWGIAGWSMTSASQACFTIDPQSSTGIGTIAIVDNIASNCSQGGIVYFSSPGPIGNTVTIGNIVYNSVQTGVGCDTGITHGGMGNFLATGDELYAAWNFSYGNITAGASCNGGGNADQTGLNFDTMGNYTGTAVAENNWLGWNGGPGFELTSGNTTINAGPVITRYNTLVANGQFASLASGSHTDFLGGIVGFGEQNVTYTTNLVDATATFADATGLQFGPHNSPTPPSVMDNNWLFQAHTGHGDNYWGGASDCLVGHASPIGPFTNTNNAGCSGNSFTTDPALTSTTEPSAPSCGGQTDTLACFAGAIANLRSSAAGSTGWGAQVAAPSDAFNTTAFLCHVYHEMPATMFAAAAGLIPNRCGGGPVAQRIIAAPSGSGTACTVIAPCSISQARTAERAASAGNKNVYLRGGTYYLPPDAAGSACGLGFNGPGGLQLNSSNDAGSTWQTYPGDTTAVLDGNSSTGMAPVVGYSTSATLSGTTLTLGGTIQGTWQVGQQVFNSAIGGAAVTITGGASPNFTVTNASSISFSSTTAMGSTTTMAGIVVQSGNSNPAPTITNLQIQDFAFAGIYNCGTHVVAQGNTLTQDGNVAEYPIDSAAIFLSSGHDSSVSNNYIHDVQSEGINASPSGAGTGAGTAIQNNMLINTCIAQTSASFSDCGAIQIENAGTNASGGAMSLVNNYIRDVFTAGAGALADGGYGVYSDSAWDLTIVGNVVTGVKGVCFFQKGTNILIENGNICDLAGGASGTAIIRVQTPGANGGAGTGNLFEHNIVVGSISGAAGGGWETDAGAEPFPTIQNNMYYNYIGSSVTNTCTQSVCGPGAVGDQAPVLSNPLLHCWGAILAATSPAFSPPTSVPGQGSTWDTPGFWGPTGFTVPHTGTAPVWPTTSGDGVTCTGSN